MFSSQFELKGAGVSELHTSIRSEHVSIEQLYSRKFESEGLVIAISRTSSPAP